MADTKQLARLKKSVGDWNKWRKNYPDAKIDLGRAVLSGAVLSRANLSGANLSGADLSGATLFTADLSGANLFTTDLSGATLFTADLSRADLGEANLSRADLSRAHLSRAHLSGAVLSGANLSRANLSGAVLSGAVLSGAHLSGTHLSGAHLGEAHLSGADLSGANLSRANLNGAILSEANLRGANLTRADLNGADLIRADLSGANLSRAILNGAILSRANLNEATFGDTSFDNADLSQAKGLETVKHEYPSSVGIDTIYKSKGNIPEVFLRGCGVPDNFIAFMRSLTGKAFDFYSCFISHSARDKEFCERVYADLQAKGVRTWYFPEDAKWGETVWGEIDRGTKIYDKLVVVLSENSLQSKPVLREIQRSLDREDKEHKNILFPITLDRYIFDTWEHERKANVLEKVVGDFCGWDKDAAKYGKAFEKLLKGLQAESAKS